MVVFTVIFGRLANLPSESGVDGRNAQIPAVRRRLGEWLKPTLCCPSRSALRTGAKHEKAVFGRRRGLRKERALHLVAAGEC
jgi:hypothetical protein